jgi:GT2 family glycosyltransferase
MSNIDYAITFACLNQSNYTKKCLDSLAKTDIDLKKVIVVDNASTDNTKEVLGNFDLGGVIYNKSNLGCGVAWNQGILAIQAEWTIIMNNDIILSAGWLEELINSAINNNLKVISPSLIEGDLDYNFDDFIKNDAVKVKNVLRLGANHAVLLAIHKSVWKDVGYFRATPKLFGYEDTIFFDDLRKADINTAITGASWIHHFGSITQKAMKLERGLSNKQGLGVRNNYKELNIGWFERKMLKFRRKQNEKIWRNSEFNQYGITLHGRRVNNSFKWI